jgi:hypothetical protein
MATKKELEQQLTRALDALDRICEVIANPEYNYPEKAGRCAVTATMALDYCGQPKWGEHFEKAYAERNPREPIHFPVTLLKVA